MLTSFSNIHEGAVFVAFGLFTSSIQYFINMVRQLSVNNNNLKLDFERICILYANTNIGYLGIMAAVLFFGFVIWMYSSATLAVFWMLAIVLAYIPRAVFSILFTIKLRKREINPNTIRPWERYFFINSILPIVCFSGALFIPFQDNSLIGILFYAVIVMLLVAGGILSYSTSVAVILLFINLFMLPLIVKCFWVQDIVFYWLGFSLVTGYILLMKLILKQNKLIMENIALKIEKENQSLIDPLTRLWNRRRLDLQIEKLLPAARRSGMPFSIILFDIDHFKHYNDTHGHSAGDDLLIKISNCMLECSRDFDLVVRYGGEEFLLVLPATTVAEAKLIVDRIREFVSEVTDVTMSAGLAEYKEKITFGELVEWADKALYSAKANGRNRYVVAKPQ